MLQQLQGLKKRKEKKERYNGALELVHSANTGTRLFIHHSLSLTAETDPFSRLSLNTTEHLWAEEQTGILCVTSGWKESQSSSWRSSWASARYDSNLIQFFFLTSGPRVTCTCKTAISQNGLAANHLLFFSGRLITTDLYTYKCPVLFLCLFFLFFYRGRVSIREEENLPDFSQCG